MSNIPADLRYTKDHEYVKQTTDAGTAAVLKRLAWLEQRLVAYHAKAFDFFNMALGIHNLPVAGNQLCSHLPGVGDRDRVGKAVNAVIWR